jgi:hypothetical protein
MLNNFFGYPLKTRNFGYISPSGFNPSKVSGLLFWYDFSDPSSLFTDTTRTTPVSVDGNTIAGVTDKSGRGNHLTQSVSGSRPAYKVGVQNGKSTALFDGTADFLKMPVAMAIPQTFSIFAITRITAEAVRHVINGDTGGRVFQFRFENINSLRIIGFNTGGTDFQDNEVLNGVAFRSIAGIRRATSVQAYINNVSGGSVSTTGTPSSDSLALAVGSNLSGNGEFFEGDIGEIIMYSGDVGLAAQAAIHSYFASKWAL